MPLGRHRICAPHPDRDALISEDGSWAHLPHTPPPSQALEHFMIWNEAGWERPGLWVPMLLGLLLSSYQAHPLPDSSPLLQFGGQVRLRFLYTDDAQRTGAYLEIRADGTVREAAHRTPESLLELKALKPGVIQILGVRTSRFLCQRPDGGLYGSHRFDPEACSFRELLLQDGYNVYQSEALGLPLHLRPPSAAVSQESALRGAARFLPLPGLPPASMEPPDSPAPVPPDVGSSDPLSMVGPPQRHSPSYAS